jgi:putative MFS transporter
MIAFRFFQGVGTGGEVPVASAYVNEFIGAESAGGSFALRGDFPDRFDVRRHGGVLSGAGLWLEGDVIVGLIPSGLTIPLRWFMPESPRWLASKGRLGGKCRRSPRDSATQRGAVLRSRLHPIEAKATARSDWRELFKGIYLKRTLMIWGLGVCAYMINNGLVTRSRRCTSRSSSCRCRPASLMDGSLSVGVWPRSLRPVDLTRLAGSPGTDRVPDATVPLLTLASLGATGD